MKVPKINWIPFDKDNLPDIPVSMLILLLQTVAISVTSGILKSTGMKDKKLRFLHMRSFLLT